MTDGHISDDWRRARAMFGILAAPPMLWLLVFFFAPLAIVWTYSFGENRSLTEIAVTGSLGEYARSVKPLYLAIICKSIWLAGLTTVICLVVGFPVAVAITFAQARTKAWLLLLVMLPFWTNLLIRTYALMAVLRTEGYINWTLALVWSGVGTVANLPAFQPLDLLHNNFAVVFGLVYVQLPFLILPLYSALDRLDRSLIEASLDLGAGHYATFARIVVPLALPGIVSGVIITFIPSLGAYLTPDLLGGTSSQMIANIIERQFKSANDWPFGAALSFLLMYITFAAIALQAMLGRRRARLA